VIFPSREVLMLSSLRQLTGLRRDFIDCNNQPLAQG
jgi:hypothetical protein